MKDLTLQNHDALIKELAFEVSKNVIDHHKWAYAEVFKNAPSTFPISMRNGIYNQICSAIKCHSDEEIRVWIENSKRHRNEMRRIKSVTKGRTK